MRPTEAAKAILKASAWTSPFATALKRWRRQDRRGLAGDVPAAGALESGGYLRPGQLRGLRRVRCLAQQLQRVGRGQILKRLQRGREVLSQLMPQPLDLPGPFPDQRLVGARDHLDAAGLDHRHDLAGLGVNPRHGVAAVGHVLHQPFSPVLAKPLLVDVDVDRLFGVEDVVERHQHDARVVGALDHRLESRRILRVHHDRVVDLGEVAFLELNVQDRADDLDDLAGVPCFLLLRGPAHR